MLAFPLVKIAQIARGLHPNHIGNGILKTRDCIEHSIGQTALHQSHINRPFGEDIANDEIAFASARSLNRLHQRPVEDRWGVPDHPVPLMLRKGASGKAATHGKGHGKFRQSAPYIAHILCSRRFEADNICPPIILMGISA